MVALLCITGVCIYFFFYSRKLKRVQFEEWKRLGLVQELEEIEGIVTHQLFQKKRFSPQLFYVEMEVTLYIPQTGERLVLLWQKPYTEDLSLPTIHKDQWIKAYGTRTQRKFLVNRLNIVNTR